jgi:DNA-binding transcriptional MerR regulator
MTDKSPDAFRTISEVSLHLDTPAHVLRFWESRFPQIRPVKRAGGRRYYRPSDVALLEGIKRLLHEDGMTIRGVQKVLREQGIRHVAGLAEPMAEDAALAIALADIEPAPPAPPPAAAEEMTVVVLAEALARVDKGRKEPGAQVTLPPVAEIPAGPIPVVPPGRAAAPVQPSLFETDVPEGPTLAARLRATPAPADADLARRLVPLRNRLASLRGRMGRAARPGLA